MPHANLASGRPNILITGAAGFIGTNLAERLILDNNVIAIDNFVTGNERNIDLLLQNPNFEFIRHDIAEPLNLDSTVYPELKKFKIDVQGIQAIYHLACPTSPRDHEKLALEILSATSLGTKNMLDLAEKYQALFVHASSQHIYGNFSEIKNVSETDMGGCDPIGPRSAYDEGKRFSETLVEYYHRQFNLQTRVARIFSTYGPKMAINNGRSIPDFILSALENRDLVIHGDEQTENTFCYINDIIDGLISLASSEVQEPINLGHYEKYKLKDIAELVIKLTDSKSAITYQKPLWHMASYNIPDISRAKEKLGWFPLMSIEDGLKKTIEFTKVNLRLYQV
jgi:nucleoside-diphosphate-sugar epimerase